MTHSSSTSTPDIGSLDRFRKIVREFYHDEIVPEYDTWEQEGSPPRTFWRRAGERGLLSVGFPPEFGGITEQDFRYNAVLTECAQEFSLALGGLRVQTDIILPYFLRYGTEQQLKQWLPRMAAGDAVTALGITEPGMGSDMKSMRTTAMRDGDEYVVNGSKTFISNGTTADVVILAASTNPAAGRDGISLLVVDTSLPGFERGRRLKKLGLHTQDLGEFQLSGLRIPTTALLGEEGQGFQYLVSNLAQERLSIAVNAQASARVIVQHAAEHFAGAKNSQHVKFTLASCRVRVAAGQAMIDQAIRAHNEATLTPEAAAEVKLYCTEAQFEVIDRCLQVVGLQAYTKGSPIGRAYVDARAGRIYAGSSEVMRIIIARSMGV